MAHRRSHDSRKGVSAGLAATFVIVTLGLGYGALMKIVLDAGQPVAPRARSFTAPDAKAATARLKRATFPEAAPAPAPAATEPEDAPVSILWPIRATRLSSSFGYRINPVTHDEQHHRGVDVPAPCGSQVLAIEDGEVVYAGYSPTAGNMVKIDHGGGWTTLYLHLARATVKAGAKVKASEQIGLSGESGALTTGPHLHFEVWKGNRAINPTAFRYHMPAGTVAEPSPNASCGPRVAVASR